MIDFGRCAFDWCPNERGAKFFSQLMLSLMGQHKAKAQKASNSIRCPVDSKNETSPGVPTPGICWFQNEGIHHLRALMRLISLISYGGQLESFYFGFVFEKEGSAMGFLVYRGALFRIPKSFVEHSNIVQPFKPGRTLPFAAFSLVCQGCHLPSFPSVGYHHEYQFFLVESSCYSLLVVSAFSSHFQPFLETFPAM